MAFDPGQFRDLVQRSLLRRDLHSSAAVELLLGTCAKESDFGTYLRQIGGGPARGAMQIEPPTFQWMVDRFVAKYPELAGRRFEEVEWDLDLSAFVARLRYKVVPEPLPDPKDPLAMGVYWEKHYNTLVGPKGGTPEHFAKAYRVYVLGEKP